MAIRFGRSPYDRQEGGALGIPSLDPRSGAQRTPMAGGQGGQRGQGMRSAGGPGGSGGMGGLSPDFMSDIGAGTMQAAQQGGISTIGALGMGLAQARSAQRQREAQQYEQARQAESAEMERMIKMAELANERRKAMTAEPPDSRVRELPEGMAINETWNPRSQSWEPEGEPYYRYAPEASTNINVDQGPDFGQSQAEDRLNTLIEGGRRAADTETMVNRMGSILTSEELNTGAFQPLVHGLQAMAEDVGFDFQGLADSYGVNINELGSAEEFDRLSRGLTMNVLQGFKGQTSDRELDFAREQVGGLGTSEQGNIRALAAMKAAAQIARENAQRAAGITSRDQFARFEQDVLGRGPERIQELTRQYEEQLGEQVKDMPTYTGGGFRDRSPQGTQGNGEADMPTVSNDEEFRQLPSGTQFRAPDGTIRVKP